jgi:hypothetical protein
LGAGRADAARLMKKTFPLQAAGKDDARVRDKIRHEVNKAVARALRKPVPEGAARWELMCKIGVSEAAAELLAVKEVGKEIDAIAETGAVQVYIEITAQGRRARPGVQAE